MDRLKQLTLLLIVTINASFIFAQKSDPLAIEQSRTETIFTTTNATTFVTGETLYYKLFCLNPVTFKPSEISKVAHVYFLKDANEIILEQKLFLKNGTASGDIFIPTSLATGNYKILASTNWMSNRPDDSFSVTKITIINPFQEETKNFIDKTGDSITTSYLDINQTNDSNISSLTTSKKIYGTRELVELDIKSLPTISSGNYAISVKKLDALSNTNRYTAVDFSKTNTKSSFSSENSTIQLPELRGELITGRITSKNNENSVNNIPIGLSIPGENFQFKVVKTNSYGQFVFTIDKTYTNPNFVLQVIGSNRAAYEIEFKGAKLFGLTGTNIKPLNLNQNTVKAIKERAVASQIENAYYNLKKDSVADLPNEKLFYTSLEKKYILDEFGRFPSLLETITEVVKEVYYTKNGNQYALGVRDYNPNRELSEPTLVLIDGILIQDANEIIDLKIDEIYSIHIIQGGYFYGSNLYNGMISFISKNHDYESKLKLKHTTSLTQIVSNREKQYYKPNYSSETSNPRIPDYRNQLLWSPEHDFKNPISFYTSDIKGTFEILIEGFTNDGLPVSLSQTFEVK